MSSWNSSEGYEDSKNSGGAGGQSTVVVESVGFGGKMFQPVEPLSLDAKGGDGRRAWDDMREGGTSKIGSRAHQEARRMAETGSLPLWRIHGKLYDLEPFLDRHPGGRDWLLLTRGTDATQAFEAYHLDGPRVEAVLANYYVRDAGDGEFSHGDRFTYDDNGFWRTLRRRVLAKLKRDAGVDTTTSEATSATVSMRAACAVALGQFFAFHMYAAKTGSLFAAVLAGIGLSGCWGVGHNFLHQSTKKASLIPYAMDLGGFHSADWKISHALSHHLDTNLETDWEYANFFPNYLDENNAKGKAMPILIPSFWLITLLNSVRYISNTVFEAATGKGKSVGKHAGHILPGFFPLMQLLNFIHSRRSIKKGVFLYLTQTAALFFAFVPNAAGVHHAVPDGDSEEGEDLQSGPKERNTFCWMEGQKGAEVDFGAHQVAATTDHTILPDSMPPFLRHWLSLTFFGYLNNHTLHHLFPGVDHSRLDSLRVVLEETAKEFGLDPKDVKSYPLLSVYKGYFKYMMGRVMRRSRL